jgi:cytochrome c biogenesis protein CcdA
MLRLLGIAISIGLADSVNPTTIAPALYLAAGARPRRQVFGFTAGVFVVYFLGGLIVALGPGELLLSLIPHPGRRLSYILETIAGVAMLTAAVFLWAHRHRLGQLEPGESRMRGRSSWLLGATITAVELPTAFPYFAVITTIVGANPHIPRLVMLLFVFNVCFVLPLLAILGILTLAGPDAERLLTAGRQWLERRWPIVLAALALLAGAFVTLLGVTGLASLRHDHFGGFARRLRHLLRP